MIRLLLAILGGLAAWRYRGPIKEYVNQQLSGERREGRA